MCILIPKAFISLPNAIKKSKIKKNDKTFEKIIEDIVENHLSYQWWWTIFFYM